MEKKSPFKSPSKSPGSAKKSVFVKTADPLMLDNKIKYAI